MALTVGSGKANMTKPEYKALGMKWYILSCVVDRPQALVPCHRGFWFDCLDLMGTLRRKKWMNLYYRMAEILKDWAKTDSYLTSLKPLTKKKRKLQ